MVSPRAARTEPRTLSGELPRPNSPSPPLHSGLVSSVSGCGCRPSSRQPWTDQECVPVARHVRSIGGGVESNQGAVMGQQPSRRGQSGTPMSTAGFTIHGRDSRVCGAHTGLVMATARRHNRSCKDHLQDSWTGQPFRL